MKPAVDNLIDSLQEIDKKPTNVILEKAKGAFNYCYFKKGSIAHLQSKGCNSKEIANLKNPNAKFVDYILHQDDSITLITSDKYYLRFYNRNDN